MSAPIFISHASEDREFAEKVTAYLEQRGVKCFIAPRDIRPGADYAEQIIDGLDAAGAIVFLLSESSNKSIFVRKEIERSVSKGKNVFTVRIREVTPARALELFVSSEQWIDAWRPPITQYLDRLAEGIAATLNIQLLPQPDLAAFVPRPAEAAADPAPPPPAEPAPEPPAPPPPPPPPPRLEGAGDKPATATGSSPALVAGGLVTLAGIAGALTYFVVLPMLTDKPVDPAPPPALVAETPAAVPPVAAPATVVPPAAAPAVPEVPPPAPVPAPGAAEVPAPVKPAFDRYLALLASGDAGTIYDELLDPDTREAVSRDTVVAMYKDRADRYGDGDGLPVVVAALQLEQLPFQPKSSGPFYYIRTETSLSKGAVADGLIFRDTGGGEWVLADVEIQAAAKPLSAGERDQAVSVATRLFQGLENGEVTKALLVSPAPDTTEWFDQVQSMRGGDLSDRKLIASYPFTELMGEAGDFVYVQFAASFTDARVTEQAWLRRDGAGWKVVRFWAQPQY